MKIFITKNYPTATFYYKVLKFLLSKASREEIESYLDNLEKSVDKQK